MGTSIEEEFTIMFDKIIENSFLPIEKKEFAEALKTFKISKDELISYSFDMLHNHSNLPNSEMEISLENLSKVKFLSKIYPLLETGDPVYLSSAKILIEKLDVILLVYQQQLKKSNTIEYENHVNNLESNKDLLRKRFNHDEKQVVNSIFVEGDFKGQQSFILKTGKFKHEKAERILKELKNSELVEKNTTLDKFKSLFSGDFIPEKNRVNWISTNMDLYLFLKKIKPKLMVEDDIYDTALRCFTIKEKTISSASNLAHSSGSKKNEKTIESIISFF